MDKKGKEVQGKVCPLASPGKVTLSLKENLPKFRYLWYYYLGTST